VAEQSIESGHWIKFHEIEVLAKTSGYVDQLAKEAIEMKLHLNRKEGFKLCKAQNPSTSLLRHSSTHVS
jgi:hypothetical protein